MLYEQAHGVSVTWRNVRGVAHSERYEVEYIGFGGGGESDAMGVCLNIVETREGYTQCQLEFAGSRTTSGGKHTSKGEGDGWWFSPCDRCPDSFRLSSEDIVTLRLRCTRGERACQLDGERSCSCPERMSWGGGEERSFCSPRLCTRLLEARHDDAAHSGRGGLVSANRTGFPWLPLRLLSNGL